MSRDLSSRRVAVGCWQSPFRWLQPARRKSRRARNCRLLLEELEQRTLLAVTVTDAAGFLIAMDAADTVAVDCSASKVRVTANGTPTSYTTNCAAVTSLNVSATGSFVNTIDLSGMAAPFAELDGLITVTAGGGNDSVAGSGFSDSLLGGDGNDTISGAAGNDTISGAAGSDTLNGGNDTDVVKESGDVDFTLTDTQLTGLGSDVLSGIEQAILTGGASANSFTVSGWTGIGTLDGQGGSDTVVSSNDANFTLTNSYLAVRPAAAPRVIIGQNFTGNTLTDVRNITGNPSLKKAPPDTMGAVGPNHYVEFTNGTFAIFNKSDGTLATAKTSDSTFWTSKVGLTFSGGLGDPRILFDHVSQRWFALEITTTATGNKVLLGRSDSSDPTGTWKGVSFTADSGFGDYPTLGLDADGVYIATNNFTSAGCTPPCFKDVSVFSIPKADLLLSTPSIGNMTSFKNLNASTRGFTIQGGVNFEVSDGHGALVAVDFGFFGQIDRTNVNGPGDAGATLSSTVTISVQSTSNPPPAKQPDGTAQIDTLDHRISANVYEVDDLLYLAHTISSSGRAAIRWTILNEATNAVVQEGTISDTNFDFFQPSIAANAFGDVVLTYNRSGTGAGDFISSFASIGSTVGGVLTFGSPTLLKAGEANYHLFKDTCSPDCERWGDYSATTRDPSDPFSFWAAQEFTKPSDVWATQITQVTPGGTFTLAGVEAAILTGGASANQLDASAFTLGGVTLDGAAGNDTLLGGTGSDSLVGGSGNDNLVGGSGNDSISGNAGNDVFVGTSYAATSTNFESLDLVPGGAGVTGILTNDDDNFASVAFPGSDRFTFYGARYSSLFVSSNGLITFSSGTSSASNSDLTSSPSQAAIAPLWDDWVTNKNSNDQVLYKFEDTNSDTVNDRLIVEWNQVTHFSLGASDVTFQAILQLNTGLQDGNITFNYPDVTTGSSSTDDGASATIGIKDTATQGPNRLLLSFNSTSLGPPHLGSTAIVFTDTADTDTIVETGDVNFTLSTTSLTGMGTDTLSGIEQASLTGGGAANTFTVSGFAGTATLDGGTGTDRVISSNDANFTLTDTSLSRSTGGTFTLTSVEEASLTGGSSANTFTVSGFAGTATLDGGTGTDRVVSSNNADFTLGASSLVRSTGGTFTLTSMEEASLTGGSSANTFTVSGWTTAGVTLDGGTGTDRVISSNDASFTLGDTSLVRSTGGTFTLTSIEEASLTGGSSATTFTVSGFTGTATLDGGTGTDRVISSNDANFTLSDASLSRSSGGTFALTSLEEASLTGGSSGNTFTVSGFTGTATLDGGTGTDRVVSSDDASFTLTDTSLSRSTGGTFALTSVEEAVLTGGSSANTFTVSGWTTAGVTLDGGTGTDRVISSNDANFTLKDTSLSRSTGGTFALTSIEEASLTSGSSANTFTVSGFAGTATLDGGNGTDRVVSSDDANFTLTDTSLSRSTGGTFTLTSVEEAVLTGGISANTFTVSDWTTGGMTLDGGTGTDTITVTGELNVSGDLSFNAETINLNNVKVRTDKNDTAGSATFTGAVVLGANVSIDTDSTDDGNVTFTSTISADDAAANNRTLTITAGGATVTLGGIVGGTQALADLDVTAATINLNATSINIDDDNSAAATVTLSGAVVLGANVAIDTDKATGTDNSVTFFTSTGTVDSDSIARALTIVAGGGTLTFQGHIGAASALDRLTVTSASLVNLSGDAYTAASSTGSSIAAPVSLQSGTRTFTVADGSAASDFTISGAISGTGGFIKSGSGTLTLTGSNTYSGATTINTGTLTLGANNVIPDGSGKGDVTVSSGATLAFAGDFSDTINGLLGSGTVDKRNGTGITTLTIGGNNASSTFNGVIKNTSGTLSLAKIGTGTMTLSGASANTYAGVTTVSAGELDLNKPGGVTTIPGGLTVSSGTVKLLQSNQVADSANVVVAGGTLDIGSSSDTVNGVQLTSGSILGSGGTLTSSSDFYVQAGSISAKLGGDVFLTKTTNGTVTLSGANTYTGTTTVISGGTLALGASDVIPDGSVVTVSSGATFAFAGDFSDTINGLFGNGTVDKTSGTGTATLMVAGGSTFSGAIKNTSGTLALAKTGSGTVTLSAANTYTGATTINAGTLLVNGSTAVGSAVTVNSGGTLGGSGMVAGAITVRSGGTLAPGSSPGSLNTGSVSFDSGSTFRVELNGVTAGADYDQTNVTGLISLGGATLSGSLGFTPVAGDTFVIISNDGSDAVSGTFNGLAPGAPLTIGGTKFHIFYNHANGNGNDVALIVNRVPTATVQSQSINEDTVGTITLSGSDPDGDSLTFKVTALPGHGKLYDGAGTGGHLIVSADLPYTVTDPSHRVTIAPDANYNGSDSFEFRVNDGTVDSSAATVSVTVNPANDQPTGSAAPPSFNIDADAGTPQTLTLSASDVETAAANLKFTITAAPAHGTLKKGSSTLTVGSTFTGSPSDVSYQQQAGYSGSDSFKFIVTDRGDPDNCGTPSASCAVALDSGEVTVAITVVDTTPPDTAITDHPVDPTNSTSASFSFSGSDNVTPAGSLTFQCRLDAGAFNACSSPKSYTGLSEAIHTFEVKATDAAGNIDPTPASFTWTVDTTAPAPSAPALDAASDSGSSNSDNVTNVTKPSFSGTAEPNGTVELFRGGGTSLGTTTANGAGAWSITLANALADGSYSITAKATDAAGNTSAASAALSITIDTTAPAAPPAPDLDAASDSGRSNSDNVTNVTKPSFSGTAEPNSTVELFRGGGTSLGTTTANGAGAWSITLANAVADGSYSITAKATDAAGNTSAASAALSITIDTTAPAAPPALDLDAASDSGSSSSDNVTNVTEPSFSGIAEPNSTVELFRGGGTSLGTTTANGAGAWSITLANALADGSHSITAKATDAAGNTSAASAALSITIDTTAPAAPSAPDLDATSDSGSSNSDNVTSVTKPSFSGTAESNSTVELFRGGSTSLGTTTANGAGAWSATLANALADGSYSITAKATDAAGNTSAASAALSITIDTTAPAAPSTPDLDAASDSGSSNSDNLTGVTKPSFSGTAEPNSTVELFRGGGTSLGTTTANGAGAWSITLAIALADGNYSITAKTMDAAGNTSAASAALSITIDTIAPAAPPAPDLDATSDSGSSNSDNVTNVTKPSFSGTAEPNSTVELFRGGGTSLGTTTANGAGAWSITLANALADGNYSITAKATDVAGNISTVSAALALTIDATAPTVLLTIPSYTVNPKPRVKVVAHDDSDPLQDGMVVTLDVDLNADGDYDDVGERGYSDSLLIGRQTVFDVSSPLADRAYLVRARIADTAGNDGISSIETIVVDAAAADIGWAVRSGQGGANPDDDGRSVAVDADGQVYVAGSLFTSGAMGGAADIFVAKYSPRGDLLWQRQFGESGSDTAAAGDDQARGIAADRDGNVYVTGFFQQTVDFDPDETYGDNRDILISEGSYDAFVVKLDAFGGFVWARRYGTGGPSGPWDQGSDVAVDADANTYVTGSWKGTAGSGDAFLLKLDTDGNLLWKRSMGGTALDFANRVALDRAGNVHVTGYFNGTADFDQSSTYADNRDILTSAGSGDVFIATLDALGNFIWARRLGGTGFDTGQSIVVSAAGDVYTTGKFQGTADFDPDPDRTATMTSAAGSFDVFVSKLNSSGAYVWSRRAGGVGQDSGNGIAVDAIGNAHLTGAFQGTVDFDPDPVGTASLASNGLDDTFIWMLDSSGNYASARRMGSAGDDRGRAIAVDVAGNATAIGQFSNTAAFDIGNVVVPLTSIGGTDVVLLKSLPGDSIAPIVTLSAPSLTNDQTPQLSILATDNVALPNGLQAFVDVDRNADGDYDDTNELSYMIAQLTNGSASFDLNPALPDGTYRLRARVIDSADNMGVSGVVAMLVDATPPIIALVFAPITNDTTPDVTIISSDAASGTPNGTEVRLDVDLNNDGDFADAGELNYTIAMLTSGSAVFDLSPALAEGTYRLQARVTDQAGNEGTSSLSTLVVDTTPPVITGSRTPAANPFGWNNTDATVRFACAEAGTVQSGIDTNTVAGATVSSEGENQSVTNTGSCTDKAGNAADSATVSGISIDKTKPLITGSRTPAASPFGWNNTDVTVSFACAEAGTVQSAIDTNTVAGATVGAEGANQSVTNTGTCADKAGNAADSATVSGINIDKAKPLITGSRSPAANAFGWNNTDVAVSFACAEAGTVQSGIDGNTVAGATVSAESANQSVTNTGDCTDRAGNTADSATISGINIDKTAPVISGSRTPAANGFGWNNTDVTVSFACSDALSGVDSVTADQTISSEGASQSRTGTCTDLADNSAMTTVSNINIDKTPPSAAASRRPGSEPNLNGWNSTNVAVGFSGVDALSGIDSCTADTTLSGEAANQSASGTCTDLAGNVSATVVLAGINIDKTAPSIAAQRDTAANANGWNNDEVVSSYSASDGLSGLPAGTASGSFTFTTEAANQSHTFSVADLAGNMASAAVSGVNIDRSPPNITVQRDTAANANGWNKTNVASSYTASDALSGLTPGTANGSFTFTAEAAAQSHTFSITDLAGNTASATVGGVNIDRTAPTITAQRDTTANANGWNNGDVAASYSASDALSGLLAGTATGLFTFTTEAVNQSHTFSVTDLAGNSASAAVSGVNIDRTAPSITAQRDTLANANGWNNGNVASSYSASDGLSGLPAGAATGSFTFTAEAVNQSHTFSVTDLAGNSASATASGVNIDRTAPSITAQRDTVANANGWNNTNVMSSYSASDGLSGLPAGTSTGSFTFTAEAANQSHTFSVTDLAGNSANATVGGVNIDRTAPSITAQRDTAANANGWNNGDVASSYTASDGLSGLPVGTASGSFIFTAEAANQSHTFSVTDLAGNSASTAVGIVNIDRTAPTITAQRDTAANASGWNNTNVASSYTASDALSGLTPGTATGAFTITAEAAAQSHTFNVTDLAGNTASATVGGVNIDRTAPSITAQRDTTANANGWNNGDVVSSYSASDALSGLPAGTATGAFTFTAEAAAQSHTFSATDLAGNIASATISGVNIDKTPPSIAARRDTAPNSNGWNNTNVASSYAASDNLSGLPAGTASGSFTFMIQESDQSHTFSVTDLAGNLASAIVSSVNIDKTPPNITARRDTAPNANGWNNRDVAASYTASDALSGLPVGTASGSFAFTIEAADQSHTFSVTDLAGNSASATMSGVNIDRTPPSITAQRETAANANGWNNTNVAASYTASDALSGLPAGTASGSFTFTAEAAAQSHTFIVTDLAGNTASATVGDVRIDRTPPLIAAARKSGSEPNRFGWNRASVTVGFDGTDALSGIAFCTPDVTVSGEGESQSVSGTCADLAGNVSPIVTLSGINIDRTAPSVTTARRPGSEPNANGWNRTSVTVGFSGSDALSGVDSCTRDITISSERTNQSVDGTCTDRAGNVGPTVTLPGINVDMTAPTLQRGELVTGRRGTVTGVVLSFSEELDSATAQNLTNYLLSQRSGRRTKNVPLRAATYAAGIVTLSPLRPLSSNNLSRYTLTVRNQRDLADIIFDGDRDGVPGGDYVSSLAAFPIRAVTAARIQAIDLLLAERGRAMGYEPPKLDTLERRAADIQLETER